MDRVKRDQNMKGRRRGGARRYSRSETPRIRWTEELHGRFIRAVDALGGDKEATPKQILRVMDVRGVSISHVKSHLQMYRITSNQAAKHSNCQSRESTKKKKKEGKRIAQQNRSRLEFNFQPDAESIQTDLCLNRLDNEDHRVGISAAEEMDCELTLSSSCNPQKKKKKKKKKKPTVGRDRESECVASVDTDIDHPRMPDGDEIWRSDCIAFDHNFINLELTISSPSSSHPIL